MTVMETVPVLPQEPEANTTDTPMSYAIGSSSFGLLPEAEGSSLKLFASVALVSVILAGTFFIAVGIRRPAQAKAPESPQVRTTQVASNVTPAPPIPDLKTVDSVGLSAPTPLPKTEAVVPTAAVVPAAAAPQLQAQVTLPAKATVPPQTPAVKPSTKADKGNVAPRPGASLAQRRAVKTARPVVAARPQQDSSNLMTVMPDPTPQVEHHAAATPTAVPANNGAVKSAQIPAARARKQVASANVGNRIKPVDMGKTPTGKIANAAIPGTAGTGLVGARGVVSSTGIPAGTVELTQAEASKKVASAGIPAATTLTVTSKRAVAPAPANLDMVSRRSNGPTKQNN
jgi:hypothetical protein